jgi:quercetin dioxygenase-like cupin family protein
MRPAQAVARCTEAMVTTVVQLADVLAEEGDGVHWTLPEPSDLNANLVRLAAGSSIPEHVNTEVDVLLVVLAGAGTLRVDGRDAPLGPGTLAHLAKGSARAVFAGGGGLSYVTVHRRRGHLQVKARNTPPRS